VRINKKQTRITIPASKKLVLEFVACDPEARRCNKCHFRTIDCGSIPCDRGDRFDGKTGYYREAK